MSKCNESTHDESTPDGTGDDDSSDDEIPVAQLARYKLAMMEKKENEITHPKKDLIVGLAKGSTDDSSEASSTEGSSKASDNSDSEDSDYHGEEDAIAQRKYLNQQRLERSRARAAVGAPLLHPIHPKTTTKMPRPTKEQIVLWENEATKRMMESTKIVMISWLPICF